ncbi:hypothetical protein LIA77_09097 [Sarocladium implicatum]|nr:hypothetical protein LIA77_09097 [Sarocladium implicatum]
MNCFASSHGVGKELAAMISSAPGRSRDPRIQTAALSIGPRQFVFARVGLALHSRSTGTGTSPSKMMLLQMRLQCLASILGPAEAVYPNVPTSSRLTVTRWCFAAPESRSRLCNEARVHWRPLGFESSKLGGLNMQGPRKMSNPFHDTLALKGSVPGGDWFQRQRDEADDVT